MIKLYRFNELTYRTKEVHAESVEEAKILEAQVPWEITKVETHLTISYTNVGQLMHKEERQG